MGEGGLLRDLGNGVSCLLQEGGCFGTRYGSCHTREFIKRHQHAPGPCASAKRPTREIKLGHGAYLRVSAFLRRVALTAAFIIEHFPNRKHALVHFSSVQFLLVDPLF